jgi:hypothetical protein
VTCLQHTARKIRVHSPVRHQAWPPGLKKSSLFFPRLAISCSKWRSSAVHLRAAHDARGRGLTYPSTRKRNCRRPLRGACCVPVSSDVGPRSDVRNKHLQHLSLQLYKKTFMASVRLVRGVQALLVAVIALLLTACASQNFGKMINNELRVGMTEEQAMIALNRLEASGKPFVGRGIDTVGSACSRSKYLCIDNKSEYLYLLYGEARHPDDLLKYVDNDTPYRFVEYQSGSNVQRLYLFFDDKTNLLRGWINPNESYMYPYMHERITSKLKMTYVEHVSKATVYALIGAPDRIIDAPTELSRELFEDHYWNLRPPTARTTASWEVYEYRLDDGSTRHVYMAYRRDRLEAFGFDHAAQEKARFMATQVRTTN